MGLVGRVRSGEVWLGEVGHGMVLQVRQGADWKVGYGKVLQVWRVTVRLVPVRFGNAGAGW